jgi:hypothetical protein
MVSTGRFVFGFQDRANLLDDVIVEFFTLISNDDFWKTKPVDQKVMKLLLLYWCY